MAQSSLMNHSDPPTNLSHLLERALRITTTDNRFFIGRFSCVDKQCNIVLNAAEEFLPPPGTEEEKEIRRNRDTWYPKSQRGGGDEPSWAKYAKRSPELSTREAEAEGEETEMQQVGEGRMLSMILVPGKMVAKIERIEEDTQAGAHII